MLRLLIFSFNGDIHCFFLLQTSKSAIHRFCLPMPFRLENIEVTTLLWRKNYDVSADVIKNFDKYMFVGRCLLILLTRQFLIWYMFKKYNVKFYLLLSSSRELSFKCWENLVIAPGHCWYVQLSSRELWYEFCLWSQQVDIAGGKDDKKEYLPMWRILVGKLSPCIDVGTPHGCYPLFYLS